MTAKEYLMQYQRLTWEIERLDRDIRALEESIDDMSMNYDGMPRSGRISKKPEEIAVRLSAARNKKLSMQAKAIKKREEISATVGKVEDATLSRLLYDRYIELKSWKDTAEDIDKSEYWTRTDLHSRALKALAVIIKK